MPYAQSVTFHLKLNRFYLIQKCLCAMNINCVIIGKPSRDVFNEPEVSNSHKDE